MRYEDASATDSFNADQALVTPPSLNANGDVDVILAGQYGPATGNAITGSGTISGVAGADLVGAGASITAIQGAGGIDTSFSGGKLQVAGEHGVLTIDAQGNYSYVRNQGSPNGVSDVFTYTLAGSDGDTDLATLTINIGKTPLVVQANAVQVVPGPDGIVTLPPGVELSDIHVVGRDLVIDMPDGTQMIIVDGAVFVPQLVLGTVEVPSTNLAALLVSSELTPAAGPPQSSGGNFAVPPPPLDPGVPLGDLIPPTELFYTPPTSDELAQAVEEDEIVLITDLTPAVSGGDVVVDEDDLPDGSDTSKESLTVAGTFTLIAPDGVESLTVGSLNVIVGGNFQAGATLTTPLGNTLTFTGYNAATGVVSYTYTLLDNEAHASGAGENSLFEDFLVTLTDEDGDVDTDTLSVNIIDDVPTANDDAFVILEGDADNAITFDVDLNDVPGADGTASRNFTSLNGTYGTITLNGDGTQTYTLNAAGIAAINGLAGGATLTDTFTYTLTDGDGDSDPAQVVITLTGVDDPVLITDLTPKAQGGDAIVDEDDLPDGSDTSKESLTVAGNFTISAPDGVNDLTVGGFNVIIDGVFQPGSHVTPLGNTLTFISYNPATGAINYSYTLNDNENHPNANGQNSIFEDFAVVLSDNDGDVANDTLSVQIIDDVPTANDDADGLVEGGPSFTDGNVITGVGTTGGPAGPGVDVPGADGATVQNAGNIAGTYGNLVLNANGSYTYTLNAVGQLAIDALAPGATLTDTFDYTLVDGDGDTDPAQLVITLTGTDDPPVITGLTPKAEGGDAIVDEDDLADGSDTSKESLTDTDTFTISAPDGVNDLTVGGFNVIIDGVFQPGSHVTPLGNTLTFISYNPATGAINYSYTLLDNESHPNANGQNSIFEDFAVVLTDTDNDVANDTLSVQIIDDVPTANDDADGLVEGGPSFTDGNVITGVGTTGGPAGPGVDVPGADGATVQNAGNIAGTYGNLVLNANGSYTYTLNAVGQLAIDALAPGATLTDTFDYTLVDGDGDTDPAQLVITLTGTDDPPVITGLTPKAEGGDAIVDEDDLADGSDTSKESLTDTDTFTISAPDGVNDLTVGGFNVIIDGVFQPGSHVTPLGNTLTFISYNPATGVISYSYTLLDNESHPNANGQNSIFEDFAVVLTDTDNDIANDTLSVQIVDDVPTAVDDVVGQVGENNPVIINAFANDTFGADGVDTDNNPVVAVTFTQPPAGQGTVSYNPATGQFTFTPAAGQQGSTQFTYTITDGDGDPSTATVTINLAADSVPIVTAAVAAVDDDGLAGGNAASVTGDLDANAGEVPLSASEATYNGTFVANFGGDAPGTFSLAAMHGTSGSVGTETVNYTYAGNVLTATGPRGVLFTVTVNPATGAYTVQLLDNVLHVAGLNENDATAALTFTASDNDGDSTNGTLTITFDDDAPTAVNDTVNQVTENSAITFGVFGNDAFGADGVDTDNNPVVAVTFTQPPAGQGTVSYNAATGQFTFTPAAGQQGSTQFTYTITDGDGDPSTATVTINLQPDSVPIVTAAVAAVDDDGLAGGNAASVTGDLDANAGEVPLSASEATYNGTFVANFGGDAPGTFSLAAMHGTSGSVGTETVNYTYAGNVLTATGPRGVLFTVTVNPTTGAYTVQLVDNVLHVAGLNENDATAALTFTASDNDGDSTNGTLTITFDDDAPTAVNDTVNQVTENQPVTFGVFGNDAFGADGVDTDNNPVVAVTFTQPPAGQGTVSYNAATGQFTFTPAAGQQGSTQFTYTITDGDGDPSTATVTINLAADSVPIVTAAVAAVDDDGLAGGNAASVTGDLDANAGEVPLSASEATYNGTFVANFGGDAPGTFSLAAMHGTSGSVGTETVNYTYAGNVLTATGPRGVLFTVTVNPATGAYTVQLLDNVLHVAGLNENDATAALTFTASDNDGDSTNGTLTITFDDDAPTAVNDTVNQVTENSAITFGVFGNDAFGADGVDTDNNPVVAVTFTQPPAGQGTVSYNAATGQFTFTPAAGQQGSTQFTYTITDGDGDPSTATVTINLQPDSVPIVTAAVAAVDDDGLAGGNAASVTGDLDANAGEVPLSASEATYNGTFVANFGGDAPGTFSLAAMHGTSGSVGTETVNYTYAGNVLTATGPRGVLFTVTVNPTTGAYTVQLVDNVLHVAGLNENDATAALTFTASDNDGDSTNGTLTITFDDDAPTLGVVQNQQASNNPAQAPAVGTLHFASGADGAGSTMTITANNTGITSGGFNLVTNQVGNILTAYQDVGPAGYDAGDTTAVYTITVNPNAGTSGQYVFDLLLALDPTVTPIDIGQGSSFGVGPSQSVIVHDDATNQDLVFVTAWSGTGGFTPAEEALWLAGNEPDWTQESDVNGSTQGWGRGNNNFDAGEILRFDFGTLDDYDNQQAPNGPYVPPAASIVNVSFATFTFFNFNDAADKLEFVAHYTDGTTQSFVLLGANSPTSLTITAPAGSTIAWIDAFQQGGSIKLNLATVGVNSTTIDETINASVQLTDGDGDATTVGNFSIHIATGLVPFAPAAPVVMDMDGDGAEFLDHSAGVAYDYDGDGTAEATGWVGADDAILVRDANGNGTVDDASEFVFGGDGVTDLEALAAQYGDTLDANDADFGKFSVWQDANSNGVADAGELVSLTAAGITSISLVSDGVSYSAANGDVEVAGTSSYTRADGSTGSVADAAFLTEQRNAANTNTAMIAALAAAGVVANQAAAQPADLASTSTVAIAASLVASNSPAVDNNDDVSRSALDGETRDAVADDASAASSSASSSDDASAGGHSLTADSDVSPASQPVDLLQATDAQASVSVDSIVSPVVSMPSADALIAASLDGAAADGSQSNAVVGRVLVDALEGGGAEASVDALLAALPAHGNGGNAAVDVLASQPDATVSAWDMGHLGGLSANANFTMEAMALHHDAVQPVANG